MLLDVLVDDGLGSLTANWELLGLRRVAELLEVSKCDRELEPAIDGASGMAAAGQVRTYEGTGCNSELTVATIREE